MGFLSLQEKAVKVRDLYSKTGIFVEFAEVNSA